MGTRAEEKTKIVNPEKMTEPKVKHFDAQISIIRGVFTIRQSFIDYLFEQEVEHNGNLLKKVQAIWSTTFVPPLNEEIPVFYNMVSREFHQLKSFSVPSSGLEILWARLESLMTEKITDEEFREISCKSPALKTNLKTLVATGDITYDKAARTLIMPYPVPPLSSILDLQLKFADSELLMLFISPNGMINFTQSGKYIQIKTRSGIYKIENPRAKTKLKIGDRAILWTNVAKTEWCDASMCRSADFKSIDIKPYDIFIFIDRYVYRPDIPSDKEQYCCKSVF